MTLSFSQQWPKSMPKHMAGQNTLFPLKVLKCLEQEYPAALHAFKMKTFFSYGRFKGFGTPEAHGIKPKIHTIRNDKNGRWSKGRNIHFVINNRTKNRYQFAPLIPCSSTEDIFFSMPKLGRMEVSIGDKYLYHSDLTKLAINDGFNHFEDFEAYFEPQIGDSGMLRTLIHWTDFRYGQSETCPMKCTSCEEYFDIETMTTDADDNWFCKECFEELAPVMKAEYEELIRKGEIERG